jgi:dienelactone hydrolase
MFAYFPDHYAWNLGFLMAAQLGGELAEMDRACRPLRSLAADDPAAPDAWLDAWGSLATGLAARAAADAAAGYRGSAARKHLRAATYFFTAERMASHRDPRKMALYRAMLDSFATGVTLGRERIAFVEVPFGAVRLPALLHLPDGPGPHPAVIHFDGFDVTKEWVRLCGASTAFAKRGIATLMVDHPGVGGALRLLGLPTSPRSEEWASAALDHLATRGDIDMARVGVAAMSLGGYFAPRAAAFEKRLACCVAWGARWDNALSHGRILRDPRAARSVTDWVGHALWVYGAADVEDAARRIAEMTLEGVAERIECPLLVVHGADDRQVPVDQAERTIAAAVRAPRRDLRVFTAAEGGAQHVQGDMFSIAIDWIVDWTADVLASDRTAGAR